MLDGFRHVFFTELMETPSLCAISLYVRPSSCESRNASRVLPFSPSSMLSRSCRVSSWLSRSSGEGAPPSGISASISRYAFSSAFRRNRSTITRLAIVQRKERGSRIVESVSLTITRKKVSWAMSSASKADWSLRVSQLLTAVMCAIKRLER